MSGDGGNLPPASYTPGRRAEVAPRGGRKSRAWVCGCVFHPAQEWGTWEERASDVLRYFFFFRAALISGVKPGAGRGEGLGDSLQRLPEHPWLSRWRPLLCAAQKDVPVLQERGQAQKLFLLSAFSFDFLIQTSVIFGASPSKECVKFSPPPKLCDSLRVALLPRLPRSEVARGRCKQRQGHAWAAAMHSKSTRCCVGSGPCRAQDLQR